MGPRLRAGSVVAGLARAAAFSVGPRAGARAIVEGSTLSGHTRLLSASRLTVAPPGPLYAFPAKWSAKCLAPRIRDCVSVTVAPGLGVISLLSFRDWQTAGA